MHTLTTDITAIIILILRIFIIICSSSSAKEPPHGMGFASLRIQPYLMAKILIIDDEKAIRAALRDILEHEKHSVDEAEDGSSGLDKAKKGAYDLVLCDIKMPKMDGLEVLEKLTAHNDELPVVMISGHGTIDTAVDALKKGAFDFIQKPPDLNRILVSVRNALDRGSLVQETKVLRQKEKAASSSSVRASQASILKSFRI